MFPGVAAPALVDAVVAAEELGLDEVWIADEGVAREPVPVLAAAAMATTRIRLGVGITSPLLRHPGSLAATVNTLDELSDGRAVLGLGVGGHLALGPFGLGTDRPVGVLADAIDMARAVLGRHPGAGYDPPPHAAPARHVPIWVGGRGPQVTAMAARRADGVFLSGCTPEQVARIVSDVRARRADIGIALYHSADRSGRDSSTASWDRVGEELELLATDWRPDAVGINLVELAGGDPRPVELVSRAAAVLVAVG